MAIGAMMAGAAGGSVVTILIQAVDGYSAVFRKVNKGTLLLGAGLTALGMAGAGAIGGLLKVAGEFEQTTVAFRTMMGSVMAGDKMLEELANFAARTPFSIQGVEQSAKQLTAMGIESHKLLPTLKYLGDVAAGTNVEMIRLAQNFGQVKTQTKLTGRELLDFNRMGVPLLREIADNMGITESEVKKLVTAGKVGFADVEQAFIDMTSEGGVFYDLMDAQSRTLPGIIQNMEDQFTKLQRVMGAELLPAAKAVANALLKIVEVAQEHPEVLKFSVAVLAIFSALALLLGPLLILKAIMPTLITLVTGMDIAFGVLVIEVLALFAAVLLLIFLIMFWRKIVTKLAKFFVIAFSIIMISINEVIELFQVGAELIENGWNKMVNNIVDGIKWMVEKAWKYIKPLLEGLNSVPGININVSGIDESLKKISLIKKNVREASDIWADSRARSKQFGEDIYDATQVGLEKIDVHVGTSDKDFENMIQEMKDTAIFKEVEALKLQQSKQDEINTLFGDVRLNEQGGLVGPSELFDKTTPEERDYLTQKLSSEPGTVVNVNIETLAGFDIEEVTKNLEDRMMNMGV